MTHKTATISLENLERIDSLIEELIGGEVGSRTEFFKRLCPGSAERCWECNEVQAILQAAINEAKRGGGREETPLSVERLFTAPDPNEPLMEAVERLDHKWELCEMVHGELEAHVARVRKAIETAGGMDLKRLKDHLDGCLDFLPDEGERE